MTPFNYWAVEITDHTDTENCRAISATAQACAMALKNITDGKTEVNKDEGYLFFGLEKGTEITPSTNTVFDVLYMLLIMINDKDPKAVNVKVNVLESTAMKQDS